MYVKRKYSHHTACESVRINNLLYLHGIFVELVAFFTQFGHTLGFFSVLKLLSFFQFLHQSNLITLRPHRLDPFTTRVSTLAIESGNVFNLQDFERNKFPVSFEDSIDTFFSLFDIDLLLIWMNTFRHGFRFRHASCPALPIVLIIS